MKFNVDGKEKELIAYQYQPDTPVERFSEFTEEFLGDLLAGHKKDLLHKRYKVSAVEFDAWQELVELNNENARLHAGLNAEQESAYEDWEMTRCMNNLDTMTRKENAFLKELTHQ